MDLTQTQLKFSEATRLISAIRLLKRYISYFNFFKINLDDFSRSLDIELAELVKYRKFLKISAKNEC